jgi:hypothetical protein
MGHRQRTWSKLERASVLRPAHWEKWSANHNGLLGRMGLRLLSGWLAPREESKVWTCGSVPTSRHGITFCRSNGISSHEGCHGRLSVPISANFPQADFWTASSGVGPSQ